MVNKKTAAESKQRKPRKNKAVEVLFPQAETVTPESVEISLAPEKAPVTQSGLLARFPDGEFREPTEEDLVQMGRAMVRRLFPQPDATIQKVETRPKPIISGAHCRICKFFDGDDDRGPLYAAKGECTLFPQPDKVMPDDLCKQKKGNGIAFEVNESLRDCNN